MLLMRSTPHCRTIQLRDAVSASRETSIKSVPSGASPSFVKTSTAVKRLSSTRSVDGYTYPPGEQLTMKLRLSQLRRIIREEVSRTLSEAVETPDEIAHEDLLNSIQSKCYACDGTGRYEHNGRTCAECGGSGVKRKSKFVPMSHEEWDRYYPLDPRKGEFPGRPE